MGGSRPGTEPVEDVASLERTIAALEAQRGVLGDDVVETALQPLRERRAVLLRRAVAEQRKLVTVLFADLVDFTVLSRRLDAEDTRAVVGAYFSRWQEAIDAQGGTVEKFIGDAVMAVFGLYQSWEDDAQRAVRAALTMTAALESLNDELEPRYGVRLQMRVGIDTGDVVVSTLEERAGHDFVAVGPTVNRASRIQSVAPAGRVLISAATHRQIRGWFSMEQVPGLRLKGIDEPVDAYLVVSERPHGFRLDRARGVEGVETTTVGRELQLRFLQERLLDVVEDRRWSVVTVLGEAGVGKSRLLLDFDSWLGERSEAVFWFRGRASHVGGNRPHALLHDIMASRFLIQDSDAPQVVTDKFEKGFLAAFGDEERARPAAHVVAVWLGFSPAGTTGIPSDPESLRTQASAALADYFAELTRTAPVVMLLEDLHWADDGSLRWLDDADRLLHDTPVLVVGTARPSLLEERARWGEGLDHHVRLPLEPLSRRASRRLLTQILQRVQDPPAALLDLVIDAAEGNPFYIEELVTWLVDAGVVVKGGDSWYVAEQLIDSVEVPSTLRGVLQARLDSLSPLERGILQRASVVGRVFWDDAVAHLDGVEGPQQAAEMLEQLRGRELVFEREVSAFDSAREFLFKHALLRDVAYDGVLRSHRERYHRLTAVWLAEVSKRTGREQEYAALIAQHFDNGRDPEAASWYLRAGQQAVSVFALQEAGRLLTRGLDLTAPADAALRFDVLAARETLLQRTGDRTAQDQDLDAMEQAIAELPGDDARLVRFRLAQARRSFDRSDYDDVVRWSEQAAEVAERAGLDEQRVQARLWRGKALTWNEDHEGAREHLVAARDLARELGRPSLEGEALRYLGMVANESGEYDQALDLIEQAREAFARDGDVEAENVVTAMRGTTAFNMGRTDEARAVFEQVLPFFRRSGHRYREAVVASNLGSVAYTQGRLADAARYAEEAVALTTQLEEQEGSVISLCVLADVDIMVRRWDQARDHLEQALQRARAATSSGLEASVLARMAELALEQDDVPGAVEASRRAVETVAHAPSPMDRGYASCARGYALLASGDLAGSEAAFGNARSEFVSIGRDELAREAAVGLSAVALGRGDTAAAAGLARPMADHVDVEDLKDLQRPSASLLIAWQALEAAGDPGADALLDRIRAYLLDRAAQIGDTAMADAYLAKNADAELLAEAARRLDR